jgi:hypothetical protein
LSGQFSLTHWDMHAAPNVSLWQLTDKVTFASEMPYYASLGGNITRTGAAPVAIQAQAWFEE